MEVISSHKHKHKREITFVIVSCYHFCSNTVKQATVPLSPLPQYYHSDWFQYPGTSVVTGAFPLSPLPCSSLYAMCTSSVMLRPQGQAGLKAKILSSNSKICPRPRAFVLGLSLKFLFWPHENECNW